MRTISCSSCGALRPHAGHGLCAPCLRNRPDRPFVYAESLHRRLVDPPEFLDAYVAYVTERFSVSRATRLIAELGRLLESEGNEPASIVRACRSQTARGGTLARVLDGFFPTVGLVPTAREDEEARRAELRRRRRLEATPVGFVSAVERSVEAELAARARAERLRAPVPRHHLTEERLDAVVGLAIAVAGRTGNSSGFEVVAEGDVVAFLATLSPAVSRRYLTHLRRFFIFARTERLVLVDPTARLDRSKSRTGVASELLPLERQRALYARWTDGADLYPYEAFVGLAGLLHGCSSAELCNLVLEDCDLARATLGLGRRPRPVPLDPRTAAALSACLAHRETFRTLNRHVTDPRFIASSFGFTYRAPLHYLADRVDSARLAELAENL